MNRKKVRYGILSSASIVPRFVKGLNLTDNGRAVSIASRSLEKAEKLAEELQIPHAYDDYQKVLEDPEVDAVYIPLINSLHYEYAKQALLAGKHAVVEKPFVLHARQAQELFFLAEEKGLFLTEAIKTPFLPLFREVKKIIGSGKYGQIRYMTFRQSYTNGSYLCGWNRVRKDGGGVLYGNEAYFFRMAEFFAGKIVSCTGMASFPNEEAEDQCSIAALMENGSLAVLNVSTKVLFDNGMTIYLDHARIEIPDYWKGWKAFIHDENDQDEVLQFPYEYEFHFELQHYSQCMLERKTGSPVNTPDMTIRYIGYCEQLYESFRNG